MTVVLWLGLDSVLLKGWGVAPVGQMGIGSRKFEGSIESKICPFSPKKRSSGPDRDKR
jgi:hypothetical protein